MQLFYSIKMVLVGYLGNICRMSRQDFCQTIKVYCVLGFKAISNAFLGIDV